MTQNTIALIIVFLAAAISVYSIVRSIVFKKSSNCDGCAGCEFKKTIIAKPCNPVSKTNFKSLKIASPKLEKLK